MAISARRHKNAGTENAQPRIARKAYYATKPALIQTQACQTAGDAALSAYPDKHARTENAQAHRLHPARPIARTASHSAIECVRIQTQTYQTAGDAALDAHPDKHVKTENA